MLSLTAPEHHVAEPWSKLCVPISTYVYACIRVKVYTYMHADICMLSLTALEHNVAVPWSKLCVPISTYVYAYLCKCVSG